jgi:predicted porin
MLALGYKHHFDKQTNWYAVYARQHNQTGAHYDLGASGHGITTDCKDAAGTCFTGATLQGVSVGMQYNF